MYYGQAVDTTNMCTWSQFERGEIPIWVGGNLIERKTCYYNCLLLLARLKTIANNSVTAGKVLTKTDLNKINRGLPLITSIKSEDLAKSIQLLETHMNKCTGIVQE